MPKPSPHCSMKSGKAGKGAGHAAYIGGGEKYAERKDVIGLFDRNLPSWAKDGVEFFAAADKFERANGRTYTEIEAAIPRSVANPVAYAAVYAEKLIGTDHPYRLAVHDKQAADGGRNIHMHLMFSDRKLDGIERPCEQFFKRAAAPYRHRVTKEMMPADPAKGGAGKDRKWNERDQVQVVRDSWQQHAKAHGIELDLRSNAAKGLGVPEPKLGPEHPRASANPARQVRKTEMERLRAVRVLKAELHEINHQEQQHARAKQDQARHHQPATDHTQMRDVWGIDNLHDLGRPQDLLQQNAPDHLRPSQAPADPARLHQLAVARAAVAAAAEAERQVAQASADAEAAKARRTAAWTERGARRRSGTPNRVMRLDQAKTQDGRTVYRWGGNGPSAGKIAVIQNGNRLAAAGKYSQPKAKAMAYIAKQNGWQSVMITGDAVFKAMALAELLEQGIAVQNPELQPQIQAWQAQAEQQRQTAAKEQEAIKQPGINPKSRYHPDNIAKAAEAAAAAAETAPVKKPLKPYRGILAQRADAKADAVSTATPSTPSEPKERERDVAASAPQYSAFNERERDLAQQIAAAIQLNDPKQLRACQARLAMVKRDAAQALAAVEPQTVNRAAIEHQIKAAQNDAARKKLQPEPWYMSAGFGSKTGVCTWDGTAQDAAQALQDHLKTPKPQGIFGRDTAATQAWMQRADALSGKAQGWLAATDTLKKELSFGIAQQVEKESQDNAARNRRNAPEHTRQLERCTSLADLEKQLEKALQPHRERQRQTGTPSRGMKR